MKNFDLSRFPKVLAVTFLTLLFLLNVNALTAQTTNASDDHFTIESYYKVKWGYAQEFINLWTANHYPLQKKAMENGDIISIVAEKPREHSGEDTRWDFRVSIVFKNAAAAFDENLTTPYTKELYPDQEALKNAEQHRFELLLAHWDIQTEAAPVN